MDLLITTFLSLEAEKVVFSKISIFVGKETDVRNYGYHQV